MQQMLPPQTRYGNARGRGFTWSSRTITRLREPSGTVNLIRKKPTADFHASGAVSYGSWNTVRVVIDVSNRLNESGSVRGRLVLAYQDGDSWMKAVTRILIYFMGLLVPI
jgi:outer membrane receptor for ferric coprogen and ferric-rhodotorulic acid